MVPIFFVFFMVPDTSPRGGFLSGAPTALASEDIGITLDTFMQAQDRYGVSWAVLAAIAWTESRFGLDMGPSSKGAVGYMQFMPTTWSGMNNPAASNKPPSWDTNPETIEQYGGYGVDANGDGVADPFDPEDAVFAAARYLSDKGFADDPRRALYQYNRSWSYVDGVLHRAGMYSESLSPQGEGIWPLPAEFTRITSPFGPRHLFGKSGFHQGVDIACPEGTPVYSVIAGRVVSARSSGVYGKCIVIQSGEMSTYYGHLSGYLVEEGDKVEQGQVIGLSGNTGVSTGPHLHFEVRMNQTPCDPGVWLSPPAQ